MAYNETPTKGNQMKFLKIVFFGIIGLYVTVMALMFLMLLMSNMLLFALG